MPQVTPEGIFEIDPNIRWAGLATRRGKVVFAQMRPGVESITPEEDDRMLLEIRAQYITEICEQVDRWAGPTEFIAMSHEKFIELIVILGETYVCVTLDKATPTRSLGEIANSIRILAGKQG